jgi:hypothetical protein
MLSWGGRGDREQCANKNQTADLGMVVHACNPSTQEAEAEGSQV